MATIDAQELAWFSRRQGVEVVAPGKVEGFTIGLSDGDGVSNRPAPEPCDCD